VLIFNLVSYCVYKRRMLTEKLKNAYSINFGGNRLLLYFFDHLISTDLVHNVLPLLRVNSGEESEADS
jgi:hypothetical protein